MLEVKVFAESVAEQIKDYLPTELQDMECRVTEQQKNNGVMRVGISCRMPGSRTEPLIYMESFYEMVQQGEPLDSVMEIIAQEMEASSKVQFTARETHMESYDEAKAHLSVRLINTDANRRMLKSVPHKDMADLSAVCCVEIPLPNNGIGSLRITNSILERWGVGKDEVFECAIKNMQESNPPIMVDMEAVLLGALSGTLPERDNLLGQTGSMDKPSDFLSMHYILTNRNKSYGAAVLMCPDVMEKISGMFPEGFYILPSSIHDLIIVPKDGKEDPKKLGELVRKVNRQHVSGEEVLSDRVYEYDREQGRIHFVPESVERAKEKER